MPADEARASIESLSDGTAVVPKALDGIRVLDLSRFWAGPAVTEFMGNLGAEIIKIEAVQSPDNWRLGGARSMSLPTAPNVDHAIERSPIYNAVNRNKLGLTLDLTREVGRDLFRRMVPLADVVVENYSPRVMEGFGLDFPRLQELNPEIVLLSLPAFGTTGPWRDFIGWAFPTEESTGFPHFTGYEGGPPMMWGCAGADAIAGMTGAVGLLAALEWRRRSGRGQHVDLSQVEAVAALLGSELIGYSWNGRQTERCGNRDAINVPQGCYPAAGDDRWVVVAVEDDKAWLALCGVVGRPDWAGRADLASSADRRLRHDELDAGIASWTEGRDADECARALQAAGVGAAPLRGGAELVDDPQLQARGFIEWIERKWTGTQPHYGMWAKFSLTPGTIRLPAPTLGEHNEEILRDLLHLSDAEIDRLATEEIIGTEPTARRKQ